MDRRRALMKQALIDLVPDGYVKEGLIFFLDGLQLCTASAWTDIVGRKTFTLYNCTRDANEKGIVFDGSSSYGEATGYISLDYAGETIEAVSTGMLPDNTGIAILNQPLVNGDCGVSLLGGATTTTIPIAYVADGQTRNYITRNRTVTQLISVNKDRVVTNHGNAGGDGTRSTSYAGYTENVTTLGSRNNASRGYKFHGTIYAVRIYNRLLSREEMLQNQLADASRYGI